ncbi:ribosome-binding protein aMBF1 (putative translation factor) [Bradyrhizobium japonicum]|jgi:ribosome-binding protein aMBF1 (putative translation factor)
MYDTYRRTGTVAKKKRVAKLGPTKVNADTEREFGTRLRLARLAKNMSQEQLATQFGLSFQQIQKYEKGTNRMSGSRLIQFSKALDTTPHQLLGGTRPRVRRSSTPRCTGWRRCSCKSRRCCARSC